MGLVCRARADTFWVSDIGIRRSIKLGFLRNKRSLTIWAQALCPRPNFPDPIHWLIIFRNSSQGLDIQLFS